MKQKSKKFNSADNMLYSFVLKEKEKEQVQVLVCMCVSLYEHKQMVTWERAEQWGQQWDRDFSL